MEQLSLISPAITSVLFHAAFYIIDHITKHMKPKSIWNFAADFPRPVKAQTSMGSLFSTSQSPGPIHHRAVHLLMACISGGKQLLEHSALLCSIITSEKCIK